MRPKPKSAANKAVEAVGQKAAKKTRILIVDDHPMMREGLAHLINQEPDLVVCGQARNVAEALSAIAGCQPGLVLTDITLPDKNGLELIKDLTALHPRLPVLVSSMHDESLYAERALRAGARGYITKEEAREKLLQAIRQVLRGDLYVNEKTSARIVAAFSGRPEAGKTTPVSLLTDREFEVFQLIGQGLSTEKIGSLLHISAKTVETHRVRIKARLGLATVPELIAYAARWAGACPDGPA